MEQGDYERPNVLRGVHFGPGTSCGFDIGWWVNELRAMGMGWVKIVDDDGSMFNFAKACREAGIMPIIRLYRKWPNPGSLGTKALEAARRYIGEGITKWLESNNEPNLPCEWLNDLLPQPIKAAALAMADHWLWDAMRIIELGGYPAIPALAQCGFHAECSSLVFYRSFFDYLLANRGSDMRHVLETGGWLSVHDATLNHFYQDEAGQWHFEYPYDPNCQSRHPGRTIAEDDNSLIGHEAPRDMIWDRWQLRVPIISTEGGVFHDVGTQWDRNYPGISSSWYHGAGTLAMFNWLDEYQKTHRWYFGICPWLLGQQMLGHGGVWDAEAWYRVGDTRPVVQMLKDNAPRRLDVVAPVPAPSPTPAPAPIPVPAPPEPSVPEPLEGYRGFPRPLSDNGFGIHLGLGDRLVGAALDEDIARARAMRIKWATVAFSAGEDIMLAAAKKLWSAGIVPIVRKVLTISPGYDYGRDTRMLVEAGIPAYVQIFNEPSDEREWESQKKQTRNYIESDNWCAWWTEAAKAVIAAGGYPGFQCLHPHEMEGLLRALPPSDPIWQKMWFCGHNYGLNHPPEWEGDQWGVLGWRIFAGMLEDHLGFVPPVICGEGGWLYKASDDARFPPVDDLRHAQYHETMFRWFERGKLPDGETLPDHLFAVCPWILSGSSDEAWYGFTERTATINAIKSIPEFVRGGTVPEPNPVEPDEPEQPSTPVGSSDYDGLADWMREVVTIRPAPRADEPHWKVSKIEIQPGTDNFSLYAIASQAQGARSASFFWADGQTTASFKADAYTIPEARQWAASMPMFNLWGSYGVAMLDDLENSESVNGLGLYQQEGEQIVKKTGHHPVLVYFEKVPGDEGAADAVPEPSDPVTPEPEQPEVPYSLAARLRKAPYGFEDLRAQVEATPGVNMAAVKKESLAAGRIDAAGNPLFHKLTKVILHHLGGPLSTPLGMVQWEVNQNTEVKHYTAPYHFLVLQTGEIKFLVGIKWLVHNAGSRDNADSVAIVFEDEANEKQMEAGRFLIAAIYEFMGQGWGAFRLMGLLPHSQIGYVNDQGKLWHTTCPGEVWPKILWSGPWPRLTAPAV
jgi:hypothetical protein